MDNRNGLVFVGLGAVCLVGAVYLFFQRRNFLRRCVETKATVVGVEPREDRYGHGRSEIPIYRFIDPRSGREVEAPGDTSKLPNSCRVGQEATILYDPMKHLQPEVVEKSFMAMWGGPVIAGVVGSVFTLIGVAVACGLFPSTT